MDGPFKLPAAASPEQNPYLPKGPPDPLVFDQFEGINTQTTRPGVDDKQAFWMDGWMPIAPRKLRTMYGVGPPIIFSDSATVSFFGFANIGSTPYCIVVHIDGSMHAVNTNTYAQTLIAPAGTITNASRLNVGLSQYGSRYVMIVSAQTNGYFLWDGNLLYGPGGLSPLIDITQGGSGYVTPPTITAHGGSGSGATFQATIANGIVTAIIVTNPGTGYLAGEDVLLTFSGGSPAGGILTALSVENAGSGYTGAPSISISGGGGSGATATCTVSAGLIASTTITNAGSGYTGTPTVTLSGGSGSGGVLVPTISTVAQATVSLMPFAISGTALEVYAGRVWVANGATITFSAPGSVSDFSSANGGGNFTSSDSFLRVHYIQLIQTNGFLYLLADSSINYISGVQTSGSPPVTTFTNQNADPEVGTPWPSTVNTFSRNILFANAFGAHVSYGASVNKISDMLDGVYNTVPNFGGIVPSAAKAIIFGKRVWLLLLPIIDPITGQQTNKIFMWDSKRWWSSPQDVPLFYIQNQEIDSVLTAWGTDGTNIYPLFQTPSTAFAKVVQTKLWDKPGDVRFIKLPSRLWGILQYYDPESPDVTISIDNENQSGSNQYVVASPVAMNWTTANGSVMNWTTQTGAVMNWQAAGIGIIEPTEISQNGVLTGMTAETNCADMAIIMLAMGAEVGSYRG